ncbi:hypothetical protein [Chlamydia sp. 17-3921]|uniref:hypothetical protein n=1 Tax=Chlamydia sp. 17-3921 TaxID=2675798 RepID=UPI001919DD1F|nr:hypothetical protein [Chlamydia sp. 17-3921]
MNHDHHDTSEADQYYFLDKDLSYNSEETISLDKYHETGVYVEEEKDDGDLLIVLGNSILQGTIRQFYISEDNLAYTRNHQKGQWELWSHIPIKTISSKTYDFNSLTGSEFLLTTNVESFINAPEDFPKGSESLNNIVISMASKKVHHYVQFFIADNRRTFWIRHQNDNFSWSDWETFI